MKYRFFFLLISLLAFGAESKVNPASTDSTKVCLARLFNAQADFKASTGHFSNSAKELNSSEIEQCVDLQFVENSSSKSEFLIQALTTDLNVWEVNEKKEIIHKGKVGFAVGDVDNNSQFSKLGIKKGDVLLKINERLIFDLNDIMNRTETASNAVVLRSEKIVKLKAEI
jgi:type II secretory pathway component PulC